MTSWTDYQDDISDAISDSMDVDWNANDGARAVVRWLNENVSLTASANDALALRAMLDNLVIAQGLSKEIREHATDAARSYLYNTRAMISAAPAPEGRAVDDEALAKAGYEASCNKKWEWAPAPCKSCNGSGMDAGSRFNRCPDCFEEAPAEAGEDIQKRVERVVFEDFYGSPLAGSKERLAKALIREFGLSALRAQPPAREDEGGTLDPTFVAWLKERDCLPNDDDGTIEWADIVCALNDWEADLTQAREDAQPDAGARLARAMWGVDLVPAANPAPDALRVAVEALEAINRIRSEMVGVPVDSEAASAWASALDASADHAAEALAALQAEQGAK